MPRFKVPDECSGLDMQYGASYKRSKSGVIEVENDAHAAAIRRSWPARHGLIKEDTVGFRYGLGAEDPENDCPECGFSAWSWAIRCGRCGAELAGHEER